MKGQNNIEKYYKMGEKVEINDFHTHTNLGNP